MTNSIVFDSRVLRNGSVFDSTSPTTKINSVTFSTCWYIFKAKFDPSVYNNWIHNFLSMVNNFNLVVYTDEIGYNTISKYKENPRILIVIKPLEQFYNYRYIEFFKKNHKKNHLLNNMVDYRVNMLWCEKVHFVNETINEKYFDTEFYGYCDIGYFRNRNNDTNTLELENWCNPEIIEKKLKKDKIYYACVNNNNEYIKNLISIINRREDIPSNQVSIAGGFFICHYDLVSWWREQFDLTLYSYFMNNKLVKDDQIIIADFIFRNIAKFALIKETGVKDNWFLFQRYLS